MNTSDKAKEIEEYKELLLQDEEQMVEFMTEFIRRLKQNEESLKLKNEKLELQQQEIIAQREFMIEKTLELEEQNKKMETLIKQLQENEEILKTQREEVLIKEEKLQFKNSQIEKNNEKLKNNEEVMKKFIIKLRTNEKELKMRNEELLTTEEELRQQQEEILAQRELVEQRTLEIEKKNKKMADNELVMSKFITKLKSNQEELKLKNEELLSSEEELRQQQEEILAQREAVEQKNKQIALSNQQLKHNEDILKKFIEKLRAKEKELQDSKDIIDASIKNAEQIQASTLPFPKRFQDTLPDSFVIFLPKDIVSGDFYWLSQSENRKIISTIDCTGHGISGAFISLLGYSILQQIINQIKLHSPQHILKYLNQMMYNLFHRDGKHNDFGMDLSMCSIQEQESGKSLLTFAGAKSNIYVIRNNKLEIFSGNKKSIGDIHTPLDYDFDSQEVLLSKGDVVYMTTDGFIDNGNKEKRKFGRKKFFKLIEDNYHKPLNEQKDIFLNAFYTHSEGAEQRDDVTVIGFRI